MIIELPFNLSIKQSLELDMLEIKFADIIPKEVLLVIIQEYYILSLQAEIYVLNYVKTCYHYLRE